MASKDIPTAQSTAKQMSKGDSSVSTEDSIKQYDPDTKANKMSDSSNDNDDISNSILSRRRRGSMLEERGSELLRTVSNYTEQGYYTGETAEEELEKSLLEAQGKSPPPPPPQYSIFAPESAHIRRKIYKKFPIIIFIFWLFILGVWSIYWGSMYNRGSRLVNLHILVNVETNSPDSQVPNYISDALVLATKQGSMPVLATWEVRNNLTEAEIHHLVHQTDYWASVYVTANDISSNLVKAFQTSTNVSNTDTWVRSYYESAKDPTTMQGIVEPTLFKLGALFQQNLQNIAYPDIMANLTSDQFASLRSTNLLTSYPAIQFEDAKPTDPVTMGPLQVGLIYIIIVTFFEVMWTTPLYGAIAPNIPPMQYIILRMILSQVMYLFISLAFTCLNAAFQISMNATWKGGFGVFWMVSYMTMSAVGGANQNVSLILFATFPPLMGFWMLFFVMLNISATFAPIPLCPEFYRFTYAMPIKNAYELMKIVLFDTTRRDIGRNVGILIAWMILNMALLPVCIMFFATMMKRKTIKEQREKAAKDAELLKN